MAKGDGQSPSSGGHKVGKHGKPPLLSVEESDDAQAGRWAAALAGDDENAAVATFTQIYNRYWRPLVAFGARYCNLTVQEAKDLVQDLFMHIWTTRREWTVHSSVFRYLLRATENRAVTRHRAENRRARREQAVTSSIETVVANDAEYAIEERELSAVLNEILDRMPPRELAVLRLRKWENRSMREIEQTLSLSQNTVRAALSSALARLHCEWRTQGWDHLTLPVRQYEGRGRNTRASNRAARDPGGRRRRDDRGHSQK